MTAEEKKHLGKVAALGCIICGAPAEIHHPRFCVGMSQRAKHFLAVGLCPEHHRQGNFGHCVHNGHQEFEKNYMTEQEMLSEVVRRLTR